MRPRPGVRVVCLARAFDPSNERVRGGGDPRLTELRRFPVKSCRGEQVETAVVEPWGLAGDRRWMLVDRPVRR